MRTHCSPNTWDARASSRCVTTRSLLGQVRGRGRTEPIRLVASADRRKRRTATVNARTARPVQCWSDNAGARLKVSL
jgi:hypothetical protein